MSRNRKNFHYHYAEKFEDKKSRKGFSKVADTFSKLPKKTFIFTLIVLILFGLVSTTFAAFVTSSDFQNQEKTPTGSLVSNVKTMKVKKDIENGDSVASLGANADVAETGAVTIYFRNTLGWSNVYFYPSVGGWNSNGVYNSGTGTQMTKVAGNIYSCSVSTVGKYYAFCKDKQDNYGNFWSTEACYNTSYSSSKTLFTPNSTSNQTTNSTKYFSNGFWSTYQPTLYLSGYLNGYDTGASSTDYKFTKSGNTYTLTFKATTNDEYMTVNDGTNVYHPKNHQDGSGTAMSTTNYSGATSDPKWKAASVNGKDVTVTFDYANGKLSWSATTYYDVSFNLNGHGSGSAPQTQTIASGGKVTEPTAPTDSNWDFGGWYKEQACTTQWNFSTNTVTANTTLYAKWTAKKYSVKANAGPYGSLTYDGSTVSKNGSLSKDVDSVNGVTISVSPDSKYTFNGWTVTGGASVASSSATSTTVKATSAGTVTATYKAKPPTISNFNYANTKINTPVTPSVTTTGDNSIHKSFVVTDKPSGSNPTINSSTGEFSSATPGTYTITLTCYNAPTDATQSDDVTRTATVKVLPSEATFDLNIQGNTRADADGTQSKPYEFNLRSTDVSVSPELTNPDDSAIYEWKTTYTGYGEYTGKNPAFTDIPTSSVSTDNEYTVTCKVTVNSVSTESTFTIYFSIVNRYLNVDSFSMQKIFSPNSASIPLNVVLDASGTNFSANISSSTSGGVGTYESIVSAYQFTKEAGIFDFTTWLSLPIKGVRYFNLDITDNSNPSLTANVNTHAAFGTESYTHTKTLYLVNSSSDSFDSYRVMAAYRIGENGADNWLTGQKMTTGKYRFTIPDNATHIGFYAMKPEKYQLVSTGTISSEFCHAYSEELYEISDSTFTITSIGSSEPCSFSGSFGPFTQQ